MATRSDIKMEQHVLRLKQNTLLLGMNAAAHDLTFWNHQCVYQKSYYILPDVYQIAVGSLYY